MNATPDPIEEWLALPFPRGSTNDALDLAHAELATIDSWIAGSVLRYRKTGEWVRPVLDGSAELSRLRSAVSAIGLEMPEERMNADSYLRYIDLLSHVYNIFLGWGDPGASAVTTN